MAWLNADLREAWRNRYDEGYFDGDGNLKPEFVQRAEIEPLVTEFVKEATGDHPEHVPLTMAQLRRFFQHGRMIERQLRSQLKTWSQVRADVWKLDVAAVDAVGKHPPKIPDTFHDFLRWNVERIDSERDFLEGFMRHFEAVVGFGSGRFRHERS